MVLKKLLKASIRININPNILNQNEEKSEMLAKLCKLCYNIRVSSLKIQSFSPIVGQLS